MTQRNSFSVPEMLAAESDHKIDDITPRCVPITTGSRRKSGDGSLPETEWEDTLDYFVNGEIPSFG